MTPYAEPMKGEITGITTDLLVQRHGPIVARFIWRKEQFVQFAGGAVYSSSQWWDGDWLPWERCRTHSFDRLARNLGCEVERA